MCIGIPMQIAAVDGIAATATDGTLIDLSLTPEARPGDHVLTFLGAAREIVTAEDAARIAAAVNALRAIMSGRTPDDAFADIEARGPQLPPHLAAAHAAGRKTA